MSDPIPLLLAALVGVQLARLAWDVYWQVTDRRALTRVAGEMGEEARSFYEIRGKERG